MGMPITMFAVGEPMPFTIPAGLSMEFDKNGIMLFINFPDLKPKEIEAGRAGKMECCLFVRQPVIFFVVKIVELFKWSDAPYSVHLTQTPIDLAHTFLPGEGMPIHIILQDSAKDIIVAQRVVGSSPEFANIFVEAVKEQFTQPFHRVIYDDQKARIQREFSSDEMAKRGDGYFRIQRG